MICKVNSNFSDTTMDSSSSFSYSMYKNCFVPPEIANNCKKKDSKELINIVNPYAVDM